MVKFQLIIFSSCVVLELGIHKHRYVVDVWLEVKQCRRCVVHRYVVDVAVKQCDRAAVTVETHHQLNANDESCETMMNESQNSSVDSLRSRLPQHWTSVSGSQVDTQTDRHTFTHTHTQTHMGCLFWLCDFYCCEYLQYIMSQVTIGFWNVCYETVEDCFVCICHSVESFLMTVKALEDILL